ncbi:holocytochrome c synthase [Coemansia sp. RSA 1365]|nr:holocytochrome c synthase [Coemansia sp. RSA 1365]
MSDNTSPKQSHGGCPVDHSSKDNDNQQQQTQAAATTSTCPVDHTQQTPSLPKSYQHSEAKCPVNHAETDDQQSQVNPLNMMPNLPQTKHAGQTSELSTERELSSIPRADSNDAEVWEYPSPQQFYNALARKQMPAPEKYMDVMVDIHNFLNEGAWDEVLKWEARHKDECKMPRLMRLQGRPRDLSPLARISSWMHGVRPFDRHDWYVDRCGKQVRYVIDYYEGVPENDMPAFNLVVRPAIDDFGSLTDRAKQLWDDAKQKYFSKDTA